MLAACNGDGIATREDKCRIGAVGYREIKSELTAPPLPADGDPSARRLGGGRRRADVGVEVWLYLDGTVGDGGILQSGDISEHPIEDVTVHMMVA